MKNKHILNALLLTAIISTSSCSDEITAPNIYPEQSTAINLGVGATSSMIVATNARASEGYEAYDYRIHANTMGGFGVKHLRNSDSKWFYIFLKNFETEPDPTDFSAGHSKHIYKPQTDFWEYVDETGKVFTEPWNSNKYDTHLFFAYMPYQEPHTVNGVNHSVALKRTGESSMTLTIPLIPGITNIPYMICHEPYMRILSGGVDDDHSRVPFKMDQIMQQYLLKFKLDASMGELRHFHITDIELFGNDLPESATYARTYTYTQVTANSWYWTETVHDYEDYKGTDIPEDKPFVIKKPVWENHQDDYYLPLSTTEYRDFGRSYGMDDEETVPSYFYVIHTPGLFTPTFKVKYSIFDENGYKTRSGEGKIVLSNKYFDITNWTNQVGYCHEIKINIVPNRLYILSDADQAQGYLILDESGTI